MPKRFRTPLVALVLALLLPVPGLAQEEVSRRDYATPGLTINTGGRTGACDVVLFTKDGKHLLAVGDDKIVRNWSVTPGGLVASDLPDLRWASWQEKRGLIHAMALSPDNALVAIGGDGMNSGTVAVLERQTGAIHRGVLGQPKFTFGKIWSMGFHPRGKAIAYGTNNGWVCVWNLDSAMPVALGQHTMPGPHGDKFRNQIMLATYLSEQKLLTVAENGEGRIWLMNAAGNGGKPLEKESFQFKTKYLHRVALSPDGKWLAAIDALSRYTELRQIGSGNSVLIGEEVNFYPYCLAFDASSKRLALGYYKVDATAGFLRETRFEVLLYDVASGKLNKKPVAVLSNIPEAVAFHPDGKQLAVAGGMDHEVTLWNLDTGKALEKSAKGRGKCIWSIGLTTDDKTGEYRYLAFQDTRHDTAPNVNQRGKGEWKLFDLRELRWADPKEKSFSPPANPTASVDGWKVDTASSQRASEWWVSRPGLTKPLVLPWDATDGLPRCYLILPAKDKHPTRLVVGHAWGASVYALIPGQKEIKRIRKFSGHEGEVMALAVSNDQKRLLTASRDQTIAGWSLEDWPTNANFGARVVLVNNQLKVEEVDAGSPAWEMGLTPKDTLLSVAVTRPGKQDQKPEDIGDKEQAIRELKNLTPGLLVMLTWRKDGKMEVVEQLTTLNQRPLFRFFPAGKEWILWRWRDHDYACSTGGDSLIGWQMNHWKDAGSKPGGDFRKEMLTPDFFGAEQMRQIYEKPNAIKAMLHLWSTKPNPVKMAEIAPPEVEVDVVGMKLQGGKIEVKDADLTIKLFAKPARDTPPQVAGQVGNQTLKTAILWINDYMAYKWEDLTKEKLPNTFTIPLKKLRVGDNEILLQCYNHAHARGQSKPLKVVYRAAPVQPVMRGLLVGVGKYNKTFPKGVPSLAANDDAGGLEKVLNRQGEKGKLYKKVILETLLDDKASPVAVNAALAKLSRDPDIRPDDLFVLYLGGHGTRPVDLEPILKEHKVPLANLDGLSPYLFCCNDLNIKNLRNTTINFNDLYELLVKIPCRKLLLLDTCHAGGVTNKDKVPANPIRELTPQGVGPVILMACQPDEFAIEHPLLDPYGRASGLFLIALSMTLEEEFDHASKKKDGRLLPEEVRDSVMLWVPKMVAILQESYKDRTLRQTPVAFVPELEKMFPLAGR
jgi:WD40 repeat protein